MRILMRSVIASLILGSGVSSVTAQMCLNGDYGSFLEPPTESYFAYESEYCLQAIQVPRCGFYACWNTCSDSYVEYCTWATTEEMYDYMMMGCANNDPCCGHVCA